MGRLYKVVVFTSANLLDEYVDDTYKLGRCIALNRGRLIFGGLNTSDCLMNVLLKGYNSASWYPNAIAITTRQFYDADPSLYKYEDEIETVLISDTLESRQKAMIENADLIILNTGAMGSLYEFCQAYIRRQIKVQNVPIVVFNNNGYWDELYQLMLKFRSVGGGSHPEKYVNWVTSISELDEFLKNFSEEWENRNDS